MAAQRNGTVVTEDRLARRVSDDLHVPWEGIDIISGTDGSRFVIASNSRCVISDPLLLGKLRDHIAGELLHGGD